MARKKITEPMTGQAFLTKVQQLGNISKADKARACGYLTTTKTGQSRINLMKFQNALLEAMGIDLEGHSSGAGRNGRTPSYRIRVQSNHNLLVSAAYSNYHSTEVQVSGVSIFGSQ
jgi:hypothetical protein